MSQLQDLLSKAQEFSEFETKQKHTWCSGCGNFGIYNALTRALVLEDIKPHQALICYDVGCNGNASDKIGTYTIHGLHGRVLSLAAGAVIANPNQEVIAVAGDGATFSEGINHLIHAIRNDYPITFIVHNNSNYGLTIGQASATTRQGYPMAGSPDGALDEPLNTLRFVLSLNPSFVARSFSGDVTHMAQMIQLGLNHPGFSYIEIMQACPTFNKATPQEWYWDKVVYTNELEHYNHRDIWEARKIVEDMDKHLAVGLLYQKDQPNFLDRIEYRKNTSTTLVEEVQKHDITHLLATFK